MSVMFRGKFRRLKTICSYYFCFIFSNQTMAHAFSEFTYACPKCPRLHFDCPNRLRIHETFKHQERTILSNGKHFKLIKIFLYRLGFLLAPSLTVAIRQRHAIRSLSILMPLTATTEYNVSRRSLQSVPKKTALLCLPSATS